MLSGFNLSRPKCVIAKATLIEHSQETVNGETIGLVTNCLSFIYYSKKLSQITKRDTLDFYIALISVIHIWVKNTSVPK